MLLQKTKVAKRIYAGVLNAGSNADGYKDEGITFPSQEMQISLFKQVQEEIGVNATHLSFMEAHGSATKVNFNLSHIFFITTFVLYNIYRNFG